MGTEGLLKNPDTIPHLVENRAVSTENWGGEGSSLVDKPPVPYCSNSPIDIRIRVTRYE
jgi:hypothetical protein